MSIYHVGMGAEFAVLAAEPGVHLFLTARREAKLKEVKERCQPESISMEELD